MSEESAQESAPIAPYAGAFPPAEGTSPFTAPASDFVDSEPVEYADYPDDAPQKPETDSAGDTADDAAGPPKDESTEDTVVEDETHADSEVVEFSDELLARAESYGFDAESARNFGTADNLKNAMVALDRQLAAYGRNELAKLGEQQAEPAKEPPAEKAAEPQPAQSGIEKFKIELDPNEFDETTIKTLNGINDHYDSIVRKQDEHIKMAAEAIVALHQQLAQFTGQAQAEESSRFAQEMDTFFTSLGDEYADVFGKGEIRSLAPSSPAIAERNKVVEEMRALQLADEMRGRPRGTLKEYQERALAVLYHNKIKETARKEVAKKVEERRSQAIQRPAGRETRSLNPIDNAVRFAEEFARKHKLYQEDDALEFA